MGVPSPMLRQMLLEYRRAHPLDFLETLYGWTFYFLTALHAAHVIGGLIPLVVTTYRGQKGRYTADSHEGSYYTLRPTASPLDDAGWNASQNAARSLR